MTTLEAQQQGTIRALREQLAQQAAEKCIACSAKDQTITLLADVIDWHRHQTGLTMQSASHAANPGPRMEVIERAQWSSDDEELIEAALDHGVLSAEAAEQALAAIQAQNTQIQIIK